MPVSADLKRNAVLTFVKKVQDCKFTGDEPIFSIPYAKILDAAQFCEREGMEFVYLGHINGEWRIETNFENLVYYIKVTATGICEEINHNFIIAVK